MKPRAFESAPSTNSPPIVLKKYGNRRLYDTSDSRYVTLPEVEEMVQRGKDVQVVDAKSGEDLTKEILVQIILDKEGAREMLPTGFLKQVVRLSASPMKESFTRVLQDSLDSFLQGQRAVVEAQRSFLQQVPYTPWNPFAAFGGAPAAHPMSPAPAPAESAELERLRSEVSETQALLRQLIVQQQGQGGASPGRPEPGRAKKKGRARPTARG
ncbi:MAG: polyhydroxyalkanoate synthesis repressor PhaR [Deltaproteobacteria bacterium]|nr:polyhydroxyalkanoate synthesis repressor PhaR [Deltaproteobacteria bacterium]